MPELRSRVRSARATSGKVVRHLRREGLSRQSLATLAGRAAEQLGAGRIAAAAVAAVPGTSENLEVARGWELVDLQERTSEVETRHVFAPRLRAEKARGRRGYRTPVRGDLVPESAVAGYESAGNLARTRRVLDLLTSDDTVLEIGTGRGYPAERYLHEGRIARYHGIELLETSVAATRQTLELNGHGTRATVEQGNLFDLTPEQVASHQPTLVICCEVLEHVPDPARALKVLADTLPEGADLLITVPLLGRLERVWGHLGLFGAARLRQLLKDAGLHAHFVEPVYATWVFVLASRSSAPNARAARAVAATPSVASLITTPEDLATSVRNKRPAKVGLTDVRGASGSAHVSSEPAGNDYVRFTVTGAGEPGTHGIAVDTPEPLLGLRLEFTPLTAPFPRAVHVDFHRDGKRIGRWTWADPATRPTRSHTFTAVLRPHHDDARFVPQEGAGLAGADHVELLLDVAPGASATVQLNRFGWMV